MTRPTVLITHLLLADGGETVGEELTDRVPRGDVILAADEEETHEHIADADILVTQLWDPDLLDAAGELDLIQAMSAGVDRYDRDRFRERGIALANASGVHAEPIAEQVLGYLLTFERGIHTGIQHQQEGVWQRYSGGEIRGKTLGVVGLGAIGSRAAEYAHAFGMTVVGTKRNPEVAPAVADEVYGPDDLFEVLGQSDYVLLSCPLTPETRGLVGREELGAMNGDAVLVNVARGEVVDEEALVYALQQGGIRGAALDVFEEEPLPQASLLWDLPNVVVTPHMAGSTPHKLERVAEIFAENYEAFADGRLEELTNRVI